MLSWRKFLTGSQERRLTSSLPPPLSLSSNNTRLLQPAPALRHTLGLSFFTRTFLRSLSHPVENQHVAPGHKSGSVKLTCTCPVFTSSSFSPLCHSAPPPHLISPYTPPPLQLTNWLTFLTQVPKIQILLKIELMPRKCNQTPNW